MTTTQKLTIDEELDKFQYESYSYFHHETNPFNGLVRDKTAPNWPSSIAATGLALASYPVAVERGFMTRAAAVERRWRRCVFSGTARKAPNPTPPATRVFIIIFST